MKIYVFDLDGTLVNSLGDIAAAVNYAMTQGGYQPVTQQRVFELIGHGIGDVLIQLIPEEKRSEEEKLRLRNDFYIPYYSQHLTDNTVVYPHVREMLRGLREKGCRLALLSNKTDRFVHGIAANLFEEGTFEYIRGAVDGFPLKPDPLVGKLVTDHFGASPQECVMVGDSHFDIDFAYACGFDSIGVDWGFAEPDELKNANAHIIVSDALQILDTVK